MANSSKANIVNFLQMQKIFIKILHGWKISLLTYKIFTIYCMVGTPHLFLQQKMLQKQTIQKALNFISEQKWDFLQTKPSSFYQLFYV